MHVTGLQEKHKQVRRLIKDFESVAVAFSGGVDSSLLLYLAHLELGDRCLAVTAHSPVVPARELVEAQAFCETYGIRHVIIKNDVFSIEGFFSNPPDRCYLCKNTLLANIKAVAKDNGLAWVVEGSNLDDENDYRPGKRAVDEHGVKSPLQDAGLTKDEIRKLSREFGLLTAEKQAYTCLATRFLYGEEITAERLARVDKAEQFLMDNGLKQIRVRSHGDLARIETDKAGMTAFSDTAFRKRVYEAFTAYGFAFVSLDLIGYKTGSMNAGI